MIKFKVGDKVSLIQRDGVYEIIEVVDDYAELYRLSDSEIWGAQYLQLVEPYDQKREFLERLQELLREYDARIYSTDFSAYMSAEVGGKGIYFNDSDITADNIMDFSEE